ncbi:MAG TPA: histidine kinase [Candidatus Binataceae bacterium]|nr:histidine kinase [Candidatus Binataceae bacterium]
MKADFAELDLQVARARIALSLLAMLSVYVDPSTGGGPFQLDRWLWLTFICHLAYSVLTYLTVSQWFEIAMPQAASTVLDLIFATAVAYLAEGRTSPSYVFFLFAIVAVGFRTGFRDTILTTSGGVALYLAVAMVSGGLANVYAMRAVYLGIAGYLIGFFGQERVGYEERLRELKAESQRHTIARALHDGYIQSLAGISLKLETCRELLSRERDADAKAELAELQRSVSHEYDEVRGFIRALAGVSGAINKDSALTVSDPQLAVRAKFATDSAIGEHILQIILEGLRNARRHAQASLVTIDVSQADGGVMINIDDDGAGFPAAGSPPWAIASRVAELGGELSVNGGGSTRLRIVMPGEGRR